MRLTQGEGTIINNEKGEFIPSYFRRLHPSGKYAIVEVSGREKRVNIHNLFVYRNGTAKRVCITQKEARVPKPSSFKVHKSSSKVPTTTPKYQKRKNKENGLLITDILSLGISISKTRVLALDDFVSETRRVPNTLTKWVKAGGQASLVYVPNPDQAITDAVQRAGGNGFTMRMDEFILRNRDKSIRFGVVYADFCGFWSTSANSLKILMENHRNMLDDEVVLHITTCRREGDVMDWVFEDLKGFAEKAGYGHVFTMKIWKTECMNKGAFFLRRNTNRIR